MEQVKNKKILDVENLKVYFYTKKCYGHEYPWSGG